MIFFKTNLIPQKSNLNVDFLLELFYNLANRTPKAHRKKLLTDILKNYKIMTEQLFFLLKLKGAVKMSAVDTYIKKINELLQNADLELLDFTFQFLAKSVEKPLNSSKEQQQSA